MITFGSGCSGIESASVAWEPIGMKPLWFSEIKKFPAEALQYHWPHVTNHGDFFNLRPYIRYGLIESPDVFVAGTPCQAFSLAGKRGGLADNRGQLTLEYVRILDEIDLRRGEGNESIGFWENVPGVLSSKDNAFGCFLGKLAGENEALQPSGKRWSDAGCVFGPKRTIAWRILDAQYFGLAQRRKRVFLISSARKSFDPCKVLFEFEGLRRDIKPSREAGQKASNCITAGIGNAQCDNLVVGSHWSNPTNPHPALTQGANAGGIGMSNQELISQGGAGLVMSSGQANAEISQDICPTLTCLHEAPILQSSEKVRRLTPVECERLQGFPDNHTQIPWRHKEAEECPDGHRYEACGNSKPVAVIRWSGERIIKELTK